MPDRTRLIQNRGHDRSEVTDELLLLWVNFVRGEARPASIAMQLQQLAERVRRLEQ